VPFALGTSHRLLSKPRGEMKIRAAHTEAYRHDNECEHDEKFKHVPQLCNRGNRLRDARTRATITTRLIRLHDQGLLPQATLALESSLSTYQVGQVEFLTVLTAVRRALDVELRYYELVADYQKALAEIERYTGVELSR